MPCGLKIINSIRTTPTRMNRTWPTWLLVMIEVEMYPASIAWFRTLSVKDSTSQKTAAPTTGPSTRAAPPSSSTVYAKNVSSVPKRSGCTAARPIAIMNPPSEPSTPPMISDCIL